MSIVTFADIQAAAARLKGIAHHTPVMTSRTLNEQVGAQVYLKCENLHGWAFHRGAYSHQPAFHAEARGRSPSRPATTPRRWLVGKLLGVKTVIVMPTMFQHQTRRHRRLWRGVIIMTRPKPTANRR
jgi:threonine dehydratase